MITGAIKSQDNSIWKVLLLRQHLEPHEGHRKNDLHLPLLSNGCVGATP